MENSPEHLWYRQLQWLSENIHAKAFLLHVESINWLEYPEFG